MSAPTIPTTPVEEQIPPIETEAAPTEVETEETQSQPEEDEDLVSARQLQAILRDPERAEQFVKNLAKNYGLFPEAPKSAAEIPTRKELKARLQEKFANLPMFSEDLGDILQEEFESLRQELKAENSGTKAEIAAANTTRQVEAYIKANKITPEMDALMSKIGQQMPPAPGVPLEEYLDNLKELAEVRMSKIQASKSRIDKINANKSTKPTNVPVAGGDQPAAPKKMSADEAVRRAMEQIQE